MGHEALVRHLIGDADRRKREILGKAREEAENRIERAREQVEAMESPVLGAEGNREFLVYGCRFRKQ